MELITDSIYAHWLSLCNFLKLSLDLTFCNENLHCVMEHIFKMLYQSTVGDSPPFGGRGIPFYLSQFVSILGNVYPDRGIKGSFLGMFGKMDLCKKILIQAYTSLI